MSGPSQMVSLRLTEEEILELDRRIGFDGMRNRSDVLRRALHKLLDETATPGEGRRITVPIGVAVGNQLQVLKEIGVDSSSAINLGIGMVLEQHSTRLRETMDESMSLLEREAERSAHHDHTE